jgi:hypothetical protein
MNTYRIKSENDPNKFYLVRHYPETNKFVCIIEATGKLCPSYAFGKLGFECKHIQEAKKQITIQSGEEPPKPETNKLIIKTKKQYEDIKIEVGKLSNKIGNKWFVKVKIKDKKTKKVKEELTLNKKYKKEIDEHQRLANAMLAYEIEHDMIPL